MIAPASTFDPVNDAESLIESLDDAARPLFRLARASLRAQTKALADVMTNRLGLRVNDRGYRSLLLGSALSGRSAQPLLLAMVGHELTRRAGLSSLVAGSGAFYCTVLLSDGCSLPLAYGSPPKAIPADGLRACCGTRNRAGGPG